MKTNSTTKAVSFSYFIPAKVFSMARVFLVMLSFGLGIESTFAQQLQLTDFVLFSGSGGPGTTAPSAPGYGVILGNTNNIINGTVGKSVAVIELLNEKIYGCLRQKTRKMK